ncbi:hypothetical protein JCM3775_000095 [Rhodotorula graminis]
MSTARAEPAEDAVAPRAPAPVPSPVSPALDFAAGTSSGIASLLVGQPLDTVKVRLQTQPRTSLWRRGGIEAACEVSSRQLYYKGAAHALVRVVREEGIAGLYKGVLGVALMNASVFTSYKYAMNAMLPHPDAEATLAQVTLAGSASGIFTSFITTPIDRLKILQQSTSVGQARQPSLLSLVRSLPPTSLYRGWTATVLRDTGYGPYFLVYEYFVRGGTLGLFGGGDKERERGRAGGPSGGGADLVDEAERVVLGGEDGQVAASATRVLVAGGLAGIVGWGCTFPIDVVKTKMQSLPPPDPSSSPSSSSSSRSAHPYATVRSTIAAVLRESGPRGFVTGLAPTLVRSVPVNMVTFAVFELVVATFR